MPNWVRTIVNIHGDKKELEALKKYVGSEESVFSFNKIIPMPEELNMVCGGLRDEYVKYYIDSLSKDEASRLVLRLKNKKCFFYGNYYNRLLGKTREIDECMIERLEKGIKEYPNVKDQSIAGIGKQYIDNILKYGTDTWYDWCCDNWGTKWDACEATLNESEKGSLTYEFETAWSFADRPLRRLLEVFPTISIDGLFADEDLGNNCGSFDTTDHMLFVEYENTLELACDVWGYDIDEIRAEYNAG